MTYGPQSPPADREDAPGGSERRETDLERLDHRAIQWMVDPVSDGGLGLDSATVAEMVGHDDGGYLIATVYTKLDQRRALARAQQAMAAFQERQDAEVPRLHVVA